MMHVCVICVRDRERESTKVEVSFWDAKMVLLVEGLLEQMG